MPAIWQATFSARAHRRRFACSTEHNLREPHLVRHCGALPTKMRSALELDAEEAPPNVCADAASAPPCQGTAEQETRGGKEQPPQALRMTL